MTAPRLDSPARSGAGGRMRRTTVRFAVGWPAASTVRVLLAAVTSPVLASYAAAVALVALLSVTAGAPWSLAGTLQTAAPLWLAAHQVPLIISTSGAGPASLGMLPMLPTVGLALLVAWSAGAAAVRLGWSTARRLGLLAAVFGGVHGVLGLLLAVLAASSRIAAAPVAATLGCAATAALAALCGGLRTTGLAAVASSSLPPWAVPGLRAGLAALAALLAGGALCTFAGLLLSAPTVHHLLAGWSGATGGQLGVAVLSLAYLPNAAVAALSVAAGPGLSIGTTSVTPFGTTAGPLPAVPLLAALPEPGPAPWRIIVFALPLLAGLLVAHHCRRVPGASTERLHAAVAAATVAACACLFLAVLAGGRLGGGAYDPVRVPPASLAIAVFAWLVVPAALVVGLPGRSDRDDGSSHAHRDDHSVATAPSADAEPCAEVEPAIQAERSLTRNSPEKRCHPPKSGQPPKPIHAWKPRPQRRRGHRRDLGRA